MGQPAYTFMVYEQVYAENGDPIEDQYVDQNADGVINEDDLIMYHSRDPKVTMAWNNTFTWKNWDLGISLRANLGNYVYNRAQAGQHTRIRHHRRSVHALQPDGGHLLFYNSSSAERLPLSSYFVENASFLRCDNITPGIHHSRLPLRRRLRSAHIRSRPESLRDNKVHRSRPRGIQRRAGFAPTLAPSQPHSASYSHSNPGLTEEKHENIQ